MVKEKRLLIFGPPGCGKGTLSGFITQKASIPHISAGEMIRAHIKAGDEIGKQAEEIVNKGQLIPDEITNHMIQERLTQDDATFGFLLDGYPRDLPQAQFLTSITEISGVIVMDVPDDLIVTRLLKRGRADDVESTIRDRIKLYHETTEPLISFVKEQNIPIHEVDGDFNIETEVNGIVDKVLAWHDSL